MDTFYYHSLFVAWVLLLFFGFDLSVVSAPKEDTYYIYNRSRRFLGASMFVLGIQVFLQWLYEFRETAQCGFSSLSFFIKQFTKATGESPAKWKKSQLMAETLNS